MSEMLTHLHLSRRESQVMDILYRLGEACVAEVLREMPDDPGYNTVRNTLAILERKGHLSHRQEGRRYLYAPRTEASAAQRSAIRHVLRTFFDGSSPQAVLAILGASEERLTKQDLAEIASYIEAARTRAT